MDCEGEFQMIRIFVIFPWLLLLMSCASQPEYFFIASFRNACDSTVKVTARHYTNTIEPFDLDVQVNPGALVVILNRVSYDNNPEAPDNWVSLNYKPEFSANGNQRSFDRELFLGILKKSKHEFDGRHHLWTINDPSLCP
jgi:hypothetical protein